MVDIVLALEQGLRPEELVNYFSSRPLELAEIHAALAYHYEHPEELEQHSETPSGLSKRPRLARPTI